MKVYAPKGQYRWARELVSKIEKISLAKQILFVVAASTILLAAAGCSKSDKSGSNVSTVEGTLALTSYPSKPTAVAATDEAGTAVTAKPSRDGKFTLSLTKGHRYRIEVRTDAGSEPIAFPRKDGTVKKTFQVTSGQAPLVAGGIDASSRSGYD